LTKIDFSDSLIGISLVYGVASISVNIIYTWILFTEYKELRFKLADFEIQKIGSLTNLGLQFFVIQLAGMIIFTTDNLIITNLFGPQSVTPYNITFKVFNMLIIMHTVVITPLWSAITQAYVEKDINWIRKVLNNLYILQVILLVFVFVFPQLIELWLRTPIHGISFLLVFSFGLYALLSTWCNIYAYIFNGLGLIRLQLKVAVFQGIINIPLSILLADYFGMGIVGVIIGTNFTLLVAAILYPIHLKKIFKVIDKEKKDEYDENITHKL
jgi:O-antigen/teichoic acid export membrane protein